MPKDIALIQQLLALNKPYYSLADMEKILGQQRPSLYVTLNRLVANGVLVRLRRGVYQVMFQSPALARIANTLVYPSYLSFESVLSRYGILSQTPYGLTFATPKRSQHLILGDTPVQFHQLKADLFWGYALLNEVYVGEPEKALLDQIYLTIRGLADLPWAELDLSYLDRERLQDYVSRFPPAVQKRVDKLLTAL